MEVVNDAGALCESGVSRTGRDCPVQREAKGRIGMIYRTRNLTGCVVVLQSKAGMRRFLKDRQRSVESKMRQAIKGGGRRAGHPVADALIEEMTLILALQDALKA